MKAVNSFLRTINFYNVRQKCQYIVYPSLDRSIDNNYQNPNKNINSCTGCANFVVTYGEPANYKKYRKTKYTSHYFFGQKFSGYQTKV